MDIFEYVHRNDQGANLMAKSDKCPTCGNLTDHDFCFYWKKNLIIIDGSPTYGICSGFSTEKAKIIPLESKELKEKKRALQTAQKMEDL
jgi:hypothetical protein